MPKSIIIKSNTHNIIEQLVNELYQYPNIRFFKRRINGEETLVIKCFNYYNNLAIENQKNFYGNYIYLYTCLSLLISDLIIETYENTLVKRILNYNYFYFGKPIQNKVLNIINLILDSNSPIENSKEFFLYRKQIILSKLLHNFRKTNYLHLDSFMNFSLASYTEFLEEVIDTIIQLFLSNSTSLEYLNFVIKNMFED